MATYVQLTADKTLDANLGLAKDALQRVTLHLSNGTSLMGIVRDLNQDRVVLTQLDRKDFYDAVVSMSAVVAVELQGRDK